MSVVAIIEDPAELAKIIEWAKKQEQKPLLSVCARSPPGLALVPVKVPKISGYTEKDRSSQTVFFSAAAELCPQVPLHPLKFLS